MEDPLPRVVQALEAEAERLLSEANAAAAEILRKTREEAEEIVSADLPLDEVNVQCRAIVQSARDQAVFALDEAETTIRSLHALARERSGDCVAELVRIVSGKEP